MRYYQLTISDPSGRVLQIERSGLGFTWTDASQGATFSSTFTPYQTSSAQLIGKPNPNALQVEFDLPTYMGQEPQGGALVRIWGLGLRCISQAWDLNPVNGAFMSFSLRGGMSAGLPLANAAQAGLIAAGNIWQSFGSWQATEQTLDMIVFAGPYPNTKIVWNWQRGTNLKSALAQMFAQAFPGLSASINIADNLIAPANQTGIYTNIAAFFKYLHRYTKSHFAQLYGSNYQGVTFAVAGRTLKIFDGTVAATAKTLAFEDLVGQPCWIDSYSITFATTLRGDITIGDSIKFPTGVLLPYALTSPGAALPNSPAASNLSFQGTFLVNELHHFANSRQPDATSWNTMVKAIYVPPSTNLVPNLS